jgi:hypothetical protein
MGYMLLGFATGIPRVRFSHTVPEPAETVPSTGTGTYRPVIFAVYQETRGILITRGYFSCIISLNIYIISYYIYTM